MKKNIEGKRSLLISIVLYCLSISIFLIIQLSIVSGTFMSGSVFSYNYPLRVAMNCLAIVCAAIAAFGKTKKLILTVKILSSIFIIAFILIFGMRIMLYLKRKKVAYGKRKNGCYTRFPSTKTELKCAPILCLKVSPLYCPKCKQGVIINAKEYTTSVIKGHGE